MFIKTQVVCVVYVLGKMLSLAV